MYHGLWTSKIAVCLFFFFAAIIMSLKCIFYSCFYCTFAGISDKPSSQRDPGVRGLSLHYAAVGLWHASVRTSETETGADMQLRQDIYWVKREK